MSFEITVKTVTDIRPAGMTRMAVAFEADLSDVQDFLESVPAKDRVQSLCSDDIAEHGDVEAILDEIGWTKVSMHFSSEIAELIEPKEA